MKLGVSIPGPYGAISPRYSVGRIIRCAVLHFLALVVGLLQLELERQALSATTRKSHYCVLHVHCPDP